MWHSVPRSSCHGGDGSQVGRDDLTGLFQADGLRDSVTSQPLGTAWWLATVASLCPCPEPGQHSACMERWPEPVRRRRLVVQQHHGQPVLPLAPATCAAGDLGPSPGHFQPSCWGHGHLGCASRGPGAAGHGPRDDPLGAFGTAFLDLRSPGPADDGRHPQPVAPQACISAHSTWM